LILLGFRPLGVFNQNTVGKKWLFSTSTHENIPQTGSNAVTATIDHQ